MSDEEFYILLIWIIIAGILTIVAAILSDPSLSVLLIIGLICASIITYPNKELHDPLLFLLLLAPLGGIIVGVLGLLYGWNFASTYTGTLVVILYAYIIGAVAWHSYKEYNAPENVKKRRIMRVRESILKEGRVSESDMSRVKQAIGTYLVKIEELGSVDLSEFCKKCDISERQAINLITFAQQHKMIEGWFTKDGKRFLTKKYVDNSLKSKLES